MKKILGIVITGLLVVSCAKSVSHGNSIAEAQLIRDTEKFGVFPVVMNKMKEECPEKLANSKTSDFDVILRTITQPLTDVSSQIPNGKIWKEIWLYRYCENKTVGFNIRFVNTGISGTTYMVEEIKNRNDINKYDYVK